MVVFPAFTAVASPFEPAALLIVAVLVVPDVQVTVAVMFCVVPSEKVPVAVNCRVVPSAIDWLVGVTAIAESVAAVTVSLTALLLPSYEAEIVVVPAVLNAAARPSEPVVLLTVAIFVLDELQVTKLVISCVLFGFIYVPVAVNC